MPLNAQVKLPAGYAKLCLQGDHVVWCEPTTAALILGAEDRELVIRKADLLLIPDVLDVSKWGKGLEPWSWSELKVAAGETVTLEREFEVPWGWPLGGTLRMDAAIIGAWGTRWLGVHLEVVPPPQFTNAARTASRLLNDTLWRWESTPDGDGAIATFHPQGLGLFGPRQVRLALYQSEDSLSMTLSGISGGEIERRIPLDAPAELEAMLGEHLGRWWRGRGLPIAAVDGDCQAKNLPILSNEP